MSSALKPALIIGSGFHRHVFSSESANPFSKRACLYDWQQLIDETSDRMQVARPDRALSPVLRWEALISSAARDGYRTPKDHEWHDACLVVAYRIEADARRHVSSAIEDASRDYPVSKRSQIPAQSKWGCVISLNFDLSWHPLAAQSAPRQKFGPEITLPRVPKAELLRLFGSLAPTGAAPRTWFPNGSIVKSSTIRMGLRDYGGAPAGIHKCFQRVKSWERENFKDGEMRNPKDFIRVAKVLDGVLGASRELAATLPRSWVTEFLYRPLIFVGVGLSEQEFGLWWLLNQRARNLARVEDDHKPPARILVRKEDRQNFWASRPFGVEAVTCDSWDRGWEEILSD